VALTLLVMAMLIAGATPPLFEERGVILKFLPSGPPAELRSIAGHGDWRRR
jgi:hypothetical protein